MDNKKIDRTGEERINRKGQLVRITAYRNNKDIDVYFPDTGEERHHVRYQAFKTGLLVSKVYFTSPPLYEGCDEPSNLAIAAALMVGVLTLVAIGCSLFALIL